VHRGPPGPPLPKERPTQQRPVEPRCLSIAETAALIGLSRSTVYRLLGGGRLRAVKCGSRTLVLADSVRAFLATSPVYQG
jgi:excisionase family DNA binding protein